MKKKRKDRKQSSVSMRDTLEAFFEYDLHVESRTIYIGSFAASIDGDESGVDSELAQRVIKALHLLTIDSKEPIRVILNNPGGSWYHGMSIYDSIRSCGCEVMIEVRGMAMSMASIILQAGTKRFIHPNAVIMVHDGQDGYYGPPKSFEAWAEYSKKIRKDMYRIYAERSGRSISFWEKKCANDFILTADQAVALGLADGVVIPS